MTLFVHLSVSSWIAFLCALGLKPLGRAVRPRPRAEASASLRDTHLPPEIPQ